MAFMRMMGADSVAYHQATILDRTDDHAGLALDYYGTRGDDPARDGAGRRRPPAERGAGPRTSIRANCHPLGDHH